MGAALLGGSVGKAESRAESNNPPDWRQDHNGWWCCICTRVLHQKHTLLITQPNFSCTFETINESSSAILGTLNHVSLLLDRCCREIRTSREKSSSFIRSHLYKPRGSLRTFDVLRSVIIDALGCHIRGSVTFFLLTSFGYLYNMLPIVAQIISGRLLIMWKWSRRAKNDGRIRNASMRRVNCHFPRGRSASLAFCPAQRRPTSKFTIKNSSYCALSIFLGY